MTRQEIALEIAKGLIETGIEGGFDAISCSTGGDYPSLGCSQWEGDRADDLLDRIPGGEKFVDRSYSDIATAGELEELAQLISSEAGQEVQRQKLQEDCLDYVDTLQGIVFLDDSRCIIYAGMWCPTSTSVVARFIRRRQERGYNIRSLETLRDMFRDEYAQAACIPRNCYEGYANRAENTFQYVAAIDLSTPYGVPVYGEGPFGR
ncbi:hypothetical protein [Selenomonas sp. AB3002]|jgi:hypothetical protein|uniref:hypothetical protein n=1 Tax=Selenomonas sp. AB3002 TaxID=1392502 RepID=UPI00068F16D5